MNITFQKSNQRAFGTFPLRGDELASAISAALDAGYRAFDTAQMYGNEAEVGAALAASGVRRDDITLTTKVSIDNFTPTRFLPSVEASLKALRVEQADLLLLHWPDPDGTIVPTLRLLESAHRLGLARAIGISNYTSAMMRVARDTVAVPLATNQVEFHPLLDQSKLLATATETGIPLSSYCSVARGEVFKHPVFAEIGQGYGKSAAQVVLRWILQTGVPINTMSTRPENIRANFDVMDFTLSSIDMARINDMKRVNYRVVDRAKVPYAPEFD